MAPVIGVFPDCFTIFGGAQYLNSSALGQYEDYLVEEIIPFVDRTYRTLPDRAHRAISGKSSGGYGAMVQSMRHPELFSAVANHSGDIYFEFGLLPDLAKLHANLLKLGGRRGVHRADRDLQAEDARPVLVGAGDALLRRGLCAEPGGAARVRHADRHGDGGAARGCVGALAGMGPGQDDRPAGVSRGLAVMTYIYMDCGLWDELNFPVGTRVLSNKLKAAGIAHDFELFPDGHPDVQYRNDVSLPRLARAIGAEPVLPDV